MAHILWRGRLGRSITGLMLGGMLAPVARALPPGFDTNLRADDELALVAQPLTAAGDAGGIASWPPASAATLDSMRGAFDAAPGLRVSLGIERAVTMNGDVVARSTGTLGLAAPAGAGLPGAASIAFDPLGAASGVALIRQGVGNSGQFSALVAGSAATLVQNSLSNQSIGVRTTIDATANSLQLLRGLNLASTLKDALTLQLPGAR